MGGCQLVARGGEAQTDAAARAHARTRTLPHLRQTTSRAPPSCAHPCPWRGAEQERGQRTRGWGGATTIAPPCLAPPRLQPPSLPPRPAPPACPPHPPCKTPPGRLLLLPGSHPSCSPPPCPARQAGRGGGGRRGGVRAAKRWGHVTSSLVQQQHHHHHHTSTLPPPPPPASPHCPPPPNSSLGLLSDALLQGVASSSLGGVLHLGGGRGRGRLRAHAVVRAWVGGGQRQGVSDQR